MFFCRIFVTTLLILLSAMTPLQAAQPKLVTEDFMIDSKAPGIQLFMRNKHAEGFKAQSGDKILLYVHGATYPSETAFDLPIEGVSMMDFFAANGYDVYLVDVRGYGRSTRPPEMEQAAADNQPIVSTVDAAEDYACAVDYVLKQGRSTYDAANIRVPSFLIHAKWDAYRYARKKSHAIFQRDTGFSG